MVCIFCRWLVLTLDDAGLTFTGEPEICVCNRCWAEDEPEAAAVEPLEAGRD